MGFLFWCNVDKFSETQEEAILNLLKGISANGLKKIRNFSVFPDHRRCWVDESNLSVVRCDVRDKRYGPVIHAFVGRLIIICRIAKTAAN